MLYFSRANLDLLEPQNKPDVGFMLRFNDRRFVLYVKGKGKSQPSTAATSLPPCSVMWNWGHILDPSNLQTRTRQSTHRRLCTRSRCPRLIATRGAKLDVNCSNAELPQTFSYLHVWSNTFVKDRARTHKLFFQEKRGEKDRQITFCDAIIAA